MGRLSYENRVQVRTPAAALEQLAVVRARLQRQGRKFDGRKIGYEAIVGAMLLEFLDRDPESQDATIQAWLARLEET